MPFVNINKHSTSEMVINQIKNEIKSGELRQGDKLPSERKLVEIMGVSRTSIREAIRALSYSGYLKSIQGKGTFVSENAKKYDEISNFLTNSSDYSFTSLLEVRKMLEGELVRLTTLRSTEEELKKIYKAFEKMKKADDIREFVREDLNFHLCIANSSHNPLMNTLMRVFGEILHKETNNIIKESTKTRAKTLEITEKMIEAIRNRNSLEAKNLMIEHIRVLKDRYK